MTINEFLQSATKTLQAAGISTARLDVLVLLEDCLNKDRTHALAYPDLELSTEQVSWLRKCVARRTKHEPLAYIRGKTEFYGREFIVNKHVLEPRPESETMIEMLLRFAGTRGNAILRIADIGSGSGAIGITASLELPSSTVDLLDIDKNTLIVAARNAKQLGAELHCIESDLLAKGNSNGYGAVLANLPYVPTDFHINKAAQAEPKLAIFGGKDGLDIYRRLFEQLAAFAWRPECILTESLPPQHKKLAQIADLSGFSLTKTEDFIQQFTPKAKN